MGKRIEYQPGDAVGDIDCIYLEESTPITYKHGARERVAIFKCSCGKKFSAVIRVVKRGGTKSCGCLRLNPAESLIDYPPEFDTRKKEQILLGTLLGDACVSIPARGGGSNSIRWEHSLLQEEYATWKADNSLINYSICRRHRFDKRTNKTYKSIICYSVNYNYEYYRKLFYLDVKTVTNEILEILKELGVAVWFMDDGCVYYNGNNCHLTLSVNGFDEDSVERIIQYFKKQYNICFKKHGAAIRITSVRGVVEFENVFKRFYHQSMLYKTLKYQKEKYNKTLSHDRKKCRNKKYK